MEQTMTSGSIVEKVDRLLAEKSISTKAAIPLILELLKDLYAESKTSAAKMAALEAKVIILEGGKDGLVSWTYIRDKMVQPAFMLFIGWLLFSFIPEQLKKLP